MSALPPVFVEFLGRNTGVKLVMADTRREMRATAAEGETAFSRFGRMSKVAIAGIGVAAAGAAIHTAKMAGDFQLQMTRVQTGAGESASKIKSVGQSVLALAGEVGQSTSELTSGLYMVESAGYHAQDAITVLRVAAEGAKVGNADLKTTTDAVTTAMNAYKMGAGGATTAMNALIATEAEGKTNLEDLAGSMANILPTSAAAKVGLNEVMGAMATMTAQGTPAKVAATYLRQTIGQLSNPSAKAAAEMKDLGLNAVKVGQNLGKHGLASTLEMLTGAIKNKMGPAGTVLITHLQKAAHNTSAYQKVLANLSPSQQTYIGALATMVGGTKSMMAALELTGPHLKDFKNNTAGITEHVKKGGKSIEGWADVQKNFNQKMAEAKASFEALQIQIGQYFLPVFSKMVGWVGKSVTWLTKHKSIAQGLAIVIGGALVAAVVALTIALWNAAVAANATGIPLIIFAVAALIAWIVILVTHWRTVWNVIKAVSLVVAKAVVDAWHWVATGTVNIWHSITGAVSSAWRSVAAFFNSAWHTVTDPIVNAWHWVAHATSAVWNSVSGFFRKWWPLLFVIFMPFLALLVAVWNHFHKAILSGAHKVWGAVKTFLSANWHAVRVIAGVLWLAIKVAVINPIKSTWSAIKAVWSPVSGWLSSLWSGIARVASATWFLIKAAIVNPLVGAWHSVTKTTSNIQHAVSTGLHEAWTKVKNIGSQFLQIGKFIVQGIIKGVTGAAGSLGGTMKNLAEGALKSAKHFLGIKSPSRKFAEIGYYIGAGLIQGLEGTTAKVKAAAAKISKMLFNEFGKSGHKHLQALVRKDGNELIKLAKQRDAVAVKLKAANKKLADLQKAWKTTRNDVAASIMQNVSVVTDTPEGATSLAASDVVASMEAQAAKAEQFANEITALKKKGLNATLIQQIADSGADAGGATAEALAKASPAQIAAINKSQKDAAKAAKKAGTQVADAMYKSGIDSAKGLVKGLQKQEKAIQKEMDKIAKGMAKALRKALGIKSPSRVFHELGEFVSQGLANGISAKSALATTAATSMAQAVTKAGTVATPSLPATARHAGHGGSHQSGTHETTVIVKLDRDVLVKAVQKGTLQYRKRNLTNGLDLKRK